jgi:histidinol-phosphate phosphatase family protein
MTAVGPVSFVAVFLDRDGVINVQRDDHVKSWEEFRFLPTALEGLRSLAEAPVPIFIVTNQSVVGRGITARAELEDIHSRMCDAIRAHGGRIDRVYVCPHAPWDDCSCRKPKPGLLLQAQEDFGVDLRRSVLVGDSPADVQAGRAVGARTALIAPAGEAPDLPFDHRANDLLGAVLWIRAHPGEP